jgi:hypothetical protein
LIASDATHAAFANVPSSPLASTAPLDIGTTAIGVIGTAAHADHVHAHGVQAGGTAHALATASVAGFFDSAEKVKLSGIAAGADQTVATLAAAVSAVSVNAQRITSVADPLAAQDAATKNSTDNAIAWQGTIKAAVRTISFTNITLSGLQTISSVSLIAGDRVLINAQSSSVNNGIYVVAAGPWTRATDYDANTKVKTGCIIPVAEGVYAGTAWILGTVSVNVGVTGLSHQFSVGAASIVVASDTRPGGGGAQGTSTSWARADHAHNLQSSDNGSNGFRLSATTTNSIPSDGTFSALALAPHTGTRISLQFNSAWVPVVLTSGISAALSGLSSGIPADVFIAVTSLTSASISFINWTNATTRAQSVTKFEGVYTLATDINKRYLGTILPDSATTFTHRAAASGASNPICGIWNQDNRILGQFTWTPAFDSWTIPTADTWQQINAQASAKIQLVQGQVIDTIDAEHIVAVNAAGASATIGIGLDSTTAPTGLRDMSSVSGSLVPLRARLAQRLAAPGMHNLTALANATSTAAVFYGAHGAMQGGLTAELWF